VPAGEGKDRSAAPFKSLELVLHSPRLPLLSIALQHLTTQQFLILSSLQKTI